MNLTNPIFNNEDSARVHMEKIRWNGCVTCPHCGGTDRIAPVKMMNKATATKPATEAKGYYHCGDCRDKFTVRTGTVYERSHVPLHKWVLATQLICSSKKGMSAHQLHRMIGVTYKTAWFMAHRIRESMADETPEPIGGPGKSVQADETYFGVKDEFRGMGWGDKKGHSNKMSVVSLISEGKSRTFHVDRANVTTVRAIVTKHVDVKSELWTDESRLYVRLGKEYAEHKTVKHTAGEYVRDGAHVNNCENYFSIFKRGMRGVYQHCSEKHLQRYLFEFDFRYNSRGMTDFERAESAVKGAEGKRLTYRRTHNLAQAA